MFCMKTHPFKGCFYDSAAVWLCSMSLTHLDLSRVRAKEAAPLTLDPVHKPPSHSKRRELYFFTNVPAEGCCQRGLECLSKGWDYDANAVQATQGHQILKAGMTLYIAKGYSWIYNVWGKGSSKTHNFLEVFGFCSWGEKSIMEARLIPIT